MSRKRIIKPEGWTTENEISYLSGIGTWGKVALSRKEMLENYIASACNRAEWGEVRVGEVIRYAEHMLEEEGA